MIRIIGIFLFAFVIMAIIGYLRGLNALDDPGRVENMILVQLKLNHEGQEYRLNYECEGNPKYYSWDIDSDKLHYSIVALRQQRFFAEKKKLLIPFDRTLILTVLGGSTAGLTVQKVMKQIKAQRFRELVGTIVGGLTGYSLGYGIAVHQTAKCNSPQLITILEDSRNWKSFECLFYKNVWNRTDEFTQKVTSLDPEKLREIKDTLLQLYDEALGDNNDITSDDFHKLVSIRKDTLKHQKPPKPLSLWIWVQTVLVGLAVMVAFLAVIGILWGIFCYWDYYLEKREKRRKAGEKHRDLDSSE
jgi:uncharacterized membrane protein YsdA (DUF1294 family)